MVRVAGDLARRCLNVCDHRPVRWNQIEVHMRSAAICLTCAALLVAPVHAQTQQAFEVASIRRNLTSNQQGGGLAGPQPGGRFIAIGVTLRRLVAGAYDDAQVDGGPAWIDTDRFDVNARADGERSPAEIRHMVRPLLAERFKLIVHSETREMPVYVLTAARTDRKLGPTLRESDATCAEEARNFFPAAPAFPPACGDFRASARTLTARGMTMPGLARLLSGRVGRPVLDRTGLEQAYDLEIEWSSDLGLQQAPPGSAGASELTPDGVSLFTALQEQLGLRLQATRGPVDVIVIDRVEPPTPN
jgi:uncharacterized protein (TIGR03435 family)